MIDLEAQAERNEIITNAENAYRHGEISADDLLWLRIFTAKEIEEL